MKTCVMIVLLCCSMCFGLTITGPYTLQDKTIIGTVDVQGAGVKILRCNIAGTLTGNVSTSTPACIRVRSNASGLVIEDCNLAGAVNGIDLSGTFDANISRCKISSFAKTGISLSGTSNGVVIQDSVISGQVVIMDGSGNSHGSGLSLRCLNVVVRGNVIHGCGNTSGITLYQGVYSTTGGYRNITIEHNLLYDISNVTALNCYDLGDNFTCKNNTLVGFWGTSTQPSQNYNTAATFRAASGKNGTGAKIYNNIFVGAVNINKGFSAYSSGNNFTWSLLDWNVGGWRTTWGNKDVVYATNTKQLRPDVFMVTGQFFTGPLNYIPKHGIDLTASYKLFITPGVGYGNDGNNCGF